MICTECLTVCVSEWCITPYCAGPSDWRPVWHSHTLPGLSTSEAFQSANAGTGSCKWSHTFRSGHWFLFIRDVCQVGFVIFVVLTSSGVGHVQPIMAELFVPVTFPSDAAFLWNPGVRVRVCFRAVSWRHCSHLYQHTEVMPTLSPKYMLKKYTTSYQAYLMDCTEWVLIFRVLIIKAVFFNQWKMIFIFCKHFFIF